MSAGLSTADQKAVDASVTQAMTDARLPGVSVLISGPKGNFAKTYGLGDRAKRTPFRRSDHVRVGSITKTFTATAALIQVDRGKLKLSDKLNKFVKGIPNGRKITIAQLLGMKSGLFDYTFDDRFLKRLIATPTAKFGNRDVLKIVRAHKPDFAPGKRVAYNDTNYVLLDLVVQKVTHRSLASVIKRDILRPLRLRHTSFPTTTRMPRPFARGYRVVTGLDSTGPITDATAINPGIAGGSGAMISTVDDVLKWDKALVKGTLLSKRTQAKRFKFGRIPRPGKPFVGYGFGIARLGDWVYHDGSIFGYSTAMFYLPANGARIVIATNLSTMTGNPATHLAQTLGSQLYPGTFPTEADGRGL